MKDDVQSASHPKSETHDTNNLDKPPDEPIVVQSLPKANQPIVNESANGVLDTSTAPRELPAPISITHRAIVGPDDLDGSLKRRQGSAFKRSSGDVKLVDLKGEGSPFKVAPDIATVVYVIDKSGSMRGERIARVTSSLAANLSQLNPQQSFCVILFDTVAHPLGGHSRLVIASEQNVKQASRLLCAVSADGGTDPTNAVEATIQLRPELIILLSDGEFSPSIVDAITNHNHLMPNKCRIDCVGLDEVVVNLQQIAQLNHGVYYQAASR
jgi:hypothetical protein